MLGKGLLVILAVLAVLAAGIFFVRLGSATTTVSNRAFTAQAVVRQPAGEAPLTGAQSDMSDYALRHLEARIAAPSNSDLSDYALRHQDARIVSPSVLADLSDYALRHPGATIRTETVPDMSDYAMRHPDALRQIEVLDRSDWYLRHKAAFVQ